MSDAGMHILVLARVVRRRILLARAAEGAAVGVIVAGVASTALSTVVLAGWLTVVSLWGVLAGMLCGGAMGGAMAAMVRGYSLLAAAELIDARRGLKERFATAVELASSSRREEPLARTCYAQTLSVLGDRPTAGVSLWRRSHRTTAGMVLAIMLTVAVGALAHSDGGLSPSAMSPAQRAELAAAMRDQARAVTAGELADALRRSADAIEQVDDAQFEQLAVELRDMGFRPAELTPEAIRTAAALMPETRPEGTADPPATTDPTPGVPGETGPAEDINRWVRVYDPDYRPAEDSEASSTDSPPLAAEAPFEETWSAAQLRATESLHRGQAPEKYREILRRYFAD
ncbi:MAG: hypothetical protein ACYS8X_02680 [Planctomycetota bacterium]|jgi:hypothetical protein